MKRLLSKVPKPTSAGWMWLAALGSAALAVYAGQGYLGARESELNEAARAGMAGRSVIVAARALETGSVISATDLALREVPERFIPSGSLGVESAGTLVGRRLRMARRGGEVLQQSDLESSSQRALSMRVAAGHRAVSLAVDELGAMSGLLLPGDEVDLYFVPAGREGDARIGLLMSRVPVLATGMRMNVPASNSVAMGDGGFSAITVQVSPEDAERLSLAQRAGQVLPVLRKTGEEETSSSRIRTARNLFLKTGSAMESQPVIPVAAPERTTLEVIVGGRGNVIAVEQTGGR